MNYNSQRWRAFRRLVPFRVRWFLALPLLILQLAIDAADGAVRGAIEGMREAWDEYPSFWDKDR